MLNKLKILGQTLLHQSGFDPFLTKHGVDFWRAGRRRRKHLALRHIRGEGLEIGALRKPLGVSSGVKVKFVDKLRHDECLSRYPELDGSKIVKPTFVDDGFTLTTVPTASQDFVIANHVLEHSPNPAQVQINWGKVLKKKGKIFVSVPVAETCFDRGRAITTLEHLIEDFNIGLTGRADGLKERNRAHYAEWIDISQPAILRERGEQPPLTSPIEREQQVALMMEAGAEIHFHTFSGESFRQFLNYFCSQLAPMFVIRVFVPASKEIVTVLEKRL